MRARMALLVSGTACHIREVKLSRKPAELVAASPKGTVPVIVRPDGGVIEMWGDGLQTRPFLYVDECLEGTTRLMRSDWTGPVNIGSDEMVTINQLAQMIMDTAGKRLEIRHIPGPTGVRGRNSDNRLIQEKLGWRPTELLIEGIRKTYPWIAEQVAHVKR